jgi:hypothetical protein
MSGILTFDTTHHALYAEEIAREQGIGAEIVPAPSDAAARCDLALEFMLVEKQQLCDALDAAGVAFKVYRG